MVDVEDSRPVEGATVSIRADKGGFCEDTEEKAFALTTQANGIVRHLCKSCMCFGTGGITVDTFAVHLPYWSFEASAPGYVTSELEYLGDSRKYGRQVRRGDGVAMLTVRIALRRVGAEPGPDDKSTRRK